MKRWIGISLALSLLLGLARGIDLLWFTDPATGLPTAGSVWWRYGGLALAVGAALWAGRQAKTAALTPLVGRQRPAGVLALAAAGVLGLAGGVGLLAWPAAPSLWTLVQGVLELICAVWLAALGRFWLVPGRQRPTRRLGWAVAASALFYWGVLQRFVENSSSWHRPGPTAAVWQQLAALLFLAALTRALYLPGQANLPALCRGGLLAFGLCFGWGLPQLLLAGQGMTGAEWISGLGACVVGLAGGVCALGLAGGKSPAGAPGQDG